MTQTPANLPAVAGAEDIALRIVNVDRLANTSAANADSKLKPLAAATGDPLPNLPATSTMEISDVSIEFLSSAIFTIANHRRFYS
jgi:hypothetical protein